jgi:hypothetical protein
MKKVFVSALLAGLISMSAVSAAFADTKPNSFTDVDRSYAKDAILLLQDKGIINGVDTKGHFNPKGSLTRAQFATIMVKALGLKADATKSSFKDVAGWAVPYVEAAYQAGIVTGISVDKFDPAATVTREMSATILVRSLQTKGKLDNKDAAITFNDSVTIAKWAKPYIGLAQKYDLVNGYPDGSFHPKVTANREMGATMGANLLKAFDVLDKKNQPEPAVAPVISSVNIESNNANHSLAKVGDTVTLTFKTAEQVTKLSNFKMNGSNPATFTSVGSGSSWTNTATYILEDSDPEGVVNFQINVKNSAGLYSITTEATNDGSSVTLLKAPLISNVSLVSNNADATKANVGDKVTLTFITNQEVAKLGNFKINGSNPSIFNSTEQTDHTWKNVATYVIEDSDQAGPVNFQINVKNVVGLYSVTTEATTDRSSVEVSKVAPVISNVSLASNNADSTKATVGDTVTLTFTTNQEVSKLGNFKINGGNPVAFTSTAQADHTWKNVATYVVDASDAKAPMTFQINVKNVDGLYSITTEATTDGSSVTVI